VDQPNQLVRKVRQPARATSPVAIGQKLRLRRGPGILEQSLAVAENLGPCFAGVACFRRDTLEIVTRFERVEIRGFGYCRNVHCNARSRSPSAPAFTVLAASSRLGYSPLRPQRAQMPIPSAVSE